LYPLTKRLFDILFSGLLLVLFFWLLLLSWILAAIDTRTNGIFIQERVGQFGKLFTIYKLRTIQVGKHLDELQISTLGQFLRNYKLDELPQLLTVLKGEMSFVGPRPDIVGYYDVLEGDDRKILELKPGLTSLAALKYYNEDALLKKQAEPLTYNDEVLFPDKIKMNLDYYYHQSFCTDFKIIVTTLKFIFRRGKINSLIVLCV